MLLTLLVFIPIVGAAACLLMPKELTRGIAVLTTLVVFGLSLFLIPPFLGGGEAGHAVQAFGAAYGDKLHFVQRLPWITGENFTIEYFVGIDGLNMPLIVLTTFVSLVSCIASWNFDHWKVNKGIKGYFILFLVLEAGMIGTFVSLDFFLFYIFWEVMLLPMYFLIGVWGGPRKEYAAIKFFLFTLAGSVLMLVALVAMFFYSAEAVRAAPDLATSYRDGVGAIKHGTFDLIELATNKAIQQHFGAATTLFLGKAFAPLMFMFLFVGFAVKLPSFPVHTWLPDAHVEAPTPISMILAGVLLKMGGYGFLRLCYPIFPAGGVYWASFLAGLGVISILYGALCAMAQTDFKKLVAYSSVSHMGYVLLGIAVMTHTGFQGAMFQMIAHGISSPMCFFLVGVIYDRAHHREINRFGGLWLTMPRYGTMATIGFFASLGLPGLCGFIGEVWVLLGVFEARHQFSWAVPVAVMAAAAVILTAGYVLWLIQRVYLGKEKPEYAGYPEASFREMSILVPFAALCVIFGIFPKHVFFDLVNGTVNQIVDVVQLAAQHGGTLAAGFERMNFENFWFPTLTDLRHFSPELAIVGTMAAILVAPLILGRSARNAGLIALAGTLVTLFLTFRLMGAIQGGGIAGLAPESAGGMLILDSLTIYFKIVLLLFMAGVTALWFIGSADRAEYGEEFFILLLGSALGMILMTSSANLLMIAVAIELASLPSYAIVAFNKRNRAAAEGSLKYVIFGAISAAIMLYGASILYGFYNTLDVAEIASRAVGHLHSGFNTVAIGLGLICFLGGIAFKIAAVPFHFWCPDVFEGAQIEVTTWLSVSSKAAALVLLVRLVDTFSAVSGLHSPAAQATALTGMAWTLGIMAAVTCTWGNFAAYRQTNVKRMLAYSSIAHAGYMMMAAAIFVHPAVATVHSPIAAVLVYILIYAVMNLGAFGVAAMVSWQTGSESIDAFSGLGRRAPWIAVPMVFCLVSLVGLPPFAGFIGKMWILLSLGEAGGSLYWGLVIIAVFNTLVSLFFYMRIVKAMFLGDDGRPAFTPPVTGVAMVNACGLALLLLGVLYIGQPRGAAARVVDNLYTASVLRGRRAAEMPPRNAQPSTDVRLAAETDRAD